jgi:hypothetical protein
MLCSTDREAIVTLCQVMPEQQSSIGPEWTQLKLLGVDLVASERTADSHTRSSCTTILPNLG